MNWSHGFKFVSVLGEIMADLAERGETRHDISLFRFNRFHKHAHIASPVRNAATKSIRPYW